MSFWSGERLAQRCKAERLIEPFVDAQVDCAAYQLTLGRRSYVSPSATEEDADRVTAVTHDEGEAFTIPAGLFGFLITDEVVCVPHDALAFISLRSRVKFRGLVNVSGFHVDPGYRGRLVFGVFNAGPRPVHMKCGEQIFLIWFTDLDRESRSVKASSGKGKDISSDLLTAVSGELHTFASMHRRMDTIEREHRLIRWVASVAISLLLPLLIAVGVRACAPGTQATGAAPSTQPQK